MRHDSDMLFLASVLFWDIFAIFVCDNPEIKSYVPSIHFIFPRRKNTFVKSTALARDAETGEFCKQ